MKLEALVKKLEGKPQQQEVQFAVWTSDGKLVCAEMTGKMTDDLVRVFAKHSTRKPSSITDTDRMNWLEKKLQYRREKFNVVRPIMGVAVDLDDTAGDLRATLDHAMREDLEKQP